MRQGAINIPQNEKKTMLVAEDAAINRALLKKIFRSEFNILEAEDGSVALDILFSTAHIDILILDIRMPKMDGFEVLREMKKVPRLENIPVIVATGSGDEETWVTLFDLGADDIFGKPYNAALMRARVQNVLRKQENVLLRARLTQKEELLKAAQTDPLTGLLSKNAFVEQAGNLIKSSAPGSYAIVRWDIDRFHVYNDLFSIKMGDDLLRRIGEYLRSQSEYARIPLAGHFTADHFVFCIPAEDADPEKLAADVSHMMNILSPEYHCVIHIGAYLATDINTDINLMCDRALLALKSTKNNALQIYAWYDDSMLVTSIAEQQLLADITAALDNNEFDIYIQPQYDQFSGKISGAEALARWIHPTRGVLPPSYFIPLMEKTGLVSKLDEIIWNRTAEFISRLSKSSKPFVPISVNISRADLFGKNIIERLKGILDKNGITSSMMHLEITESAYVGHPELFTPIVEKLQSLGFTIEMDDFGSEYSSLNTLKYMPVDIIKLDLNFLAGDNSREKNNSGIILSSVVRMAHWLNLPVIAEGVENVFQADYLKSIGCRYAQGYLYSKPIPTESFLDLLEWDMTAPVAAEKFTKNYFQGIDFWQPESQYSFIFNIFAGSAGIFEYYNGNLECLRVNDAYLKELNITMEHVNDYRLSVFDVIHEDDRNALRELLDKAKNSNDEFTIELRCVSQERNIPVIWISARLRQLSACLDRVVFFASIENITPGKEMDSALRRENEYCRLILSNGNAYLFDYSIKDDFLSLQAISKDGSIVYNSYNNYCRGGVRKKTICPEDFDNMHDLFAGTYPLSRGRYDCRVFNRDTQSYVWYRIFFSVIKDKSTGSPTNVIGRLQNIDAEKQNEKHISELTKGMGKVQLHNSDIVISVFSRLYQADNIDESINFVLEKLRKFSDADRAYIAMENPDHSGFSVTYENLREGILSKKEAYKKILYSQLEIPVEKLNNYDENGIQIIQNADLCDPELQALMKEHGVKASVHFALCKDGEYIGYVGFDDERRARVPEPEMIGTLSLVSNIIGLFITSEQTNIKARHSDEFLNVIDNNPVVISVADPEAGEIIYTNKSANECLGELSATNPCYKQFFAKNETLGVSLVEACTKTGSTMPVEILCPNDTWLLCQAMPVKWQGKDRVLLFCVDITQKKEIEANNEIAYMTLRIAIEHMGKKICIYHVSDRTLEIPCSAAEELQIKDTLIKVPDGLSAALSIRKGSPQLREYAAFFRDIDRGKPAGTSEIAHTFPNGEEKWFRVDFSSVFNSEGKAVQAIIALEDTTDVHTEKLKQLAETEKLVAAVESVFTFALSVDLTHDTYYTIHKKPHFIRQFDSMGEYSLLAERALRRIKPEDHKSFTALFSRDSLLKARADSKMRIAAEFRELGDNGVWEWVKIIVLFVDTPDSGNVSCVFLARVMGDKKAVEMGLDTEADLRIDQNNLYLISESLPAEVLIYDPETKEKTYACGKLLETLGYSAAEADDICSKWLLPIIYENDIPLFNARMNLIEDRTLSTSEGRFRIYKKDRELTWLAAHYVVSQDLNGREIYVCTMHEITNEVASEKNYRDAVNFMNIASGLYSRVVYRYDSSTGIANAINPELCKESKLPETLTVDFEHAVKSHVMADSADDFKHFFSEINTGASEGIARLNMRFGEDKPYKWYELRFRSLVDPDGVINATAISVLDINDSYEKELAYAQHIVKSKAEQKNSLGRIDADLTANAIERQSNLPYSVTSLVGKTHDEAIRYLVEKYLPDTKDREKECIYKKYSRANLLRLEGEGELGIQDEFKLDMGYGVPCWLSVNINFVRDPYTRNVKSFCQIRDITKTKSRDMRIRRMAEIDSLSGIYNRQMTERYINEILEDGRSCALLMLDLDDLKKLNDLYGHKNGDMAIEAIGSVLNSHFRKQDVVGRVGGDEFVVLLVDVTPETNIEPTVSSLQKKLKEIRIGDDKNISIRCSIGCAYSSEDARDFYSLYNQADKALYYIKRSKKGSFAFYLPDMD